MKPLLIYVVAVEVGPTQWAVSCEICDDIVSEPTQDGVLADQFEFEHRTFHDYWDHWEDFADTADKDDKEGG